MPRAVDVKPRKQPRQERSRSMEGILLEAAARVLEEDGAAGFNTNRVAERAGVSVGSLYQYFPNKAAILFRLHEQESSVNVVEFDRILSDSDRSPRARVTAAVRYFFETEALEVPLRRSLKLAEVYFRDSPEFAAIEHAVVLQIAAFLKRERRTSRRRAEFDAGFVALVLGSVSEAITERGMRGDELRRYADECSTMLCNHLELD